MPRGGSAPKTPPLPRKEPASRGSASPELTQTHNGRLSFTVSDPEKHGTSPVNAFVDYKLHTTTELARFSARDFFVRRRYRDFVWLRDRLCVAYPGCIVPPLPMVDSLLKDDRFSSNFIQRRQAGLQLFLRRVAGHEKLRESADLQTFLEAKVWQLQTVKNATVRPAAWPRAPNSTPEGGPCFACCFVEGVALAGPPCGALSRPRAHLLLPAATPLPQLPCPPSTPLPQLHCRNSPATTPLQLPCHNSP
jgi:hypothetical protein